MVRNRKKDNTKAQLIFSNMILQMDTPRLYWVSHKADPEAKFRCKVITLEVNSEGKHDNGMGKKESQ